MAFPFQECVRRPLNTKWPNCFPAFVFWTKLASLFLNSSSRHFCVTHRQSKHFLCEMVRKLTLNISNRTSFCLNNSLNLPCVEQVRCTYFDRFLENCSLVWPTNPCQVSNKAFKNIGESQNHLWKIHESPASTRVAQKGSPWDPPNAFAPPKRLGSVDRRGWNDANGHGFWDPENSGVFWQRRIENRSIQSCESKKIYWDARPFPAANERFSIVVYLVSPVLLGGGHPCVYSRFFLLKLSTN